MPEIKITLDFKREFDTYEEIEDYARHVATFIDELEGIEGVRVTSSVTVDGVTISIPR